MQKNTEIQTKQPSTSYNIPMTRSRTQPRRETPSVRPVTRSSVQSQVPLPPTQTTSDDQQKQPEANHSRPVTRIHSQRASPDIQSSPSVHTLSVGQTASLSDDTLRRQIFMSMVQNIRDSIRDSTEQLLENTSAQPMLSNSGMTTDPTHIRHDNIAEMMPYTSLPTALNAITNEYASDHIVDIYGTDSCDIALSRNRTAVVLDTLEVIFNVKKICVLRKVGYIFTHDGAVYTVEHIHGKTRVKLFTNSVKDILEFFGDWHDEQCAIILKEDGTTYYTIVDGDGVHMRPLGIGVNRIQKVITSSNTHAFSNDVFATITKHEETKTEVVDIFFVPYHIHQRNRRVGNERMYIEGTVKTIYGATAGNVYHNNTFVVLNTTGGFTASEYLTRGYIPYQQDKTITDKLQHGVIGVYTNNSGVVAHRDTGEVITLQFVGDAFPINVKAKMKKIVVAGDYWYGLTVDDTVVYWSRFSPEEHKLGLLPVSRGPSLQDLFDFTDGKVQDIYPFPYSVIIVFDSGKHLHIPSSFINNWDDRISELVYEQPTFYKHVSHDGAHQSVIVGRKENKNYLIYSGWSNGVQSKRVHDGNIQQVYRNSSSYIVLFDDGTVHGQDFTPPMVGTDVTNVIQTKLRDIIKIFPIQYGRFAALTKTGHIYIWGYKHGRVAYKLPPMNELLVAHLRFAYNSAEITIL